MQQPVYRAPQTERPRRRRGAFSRFLRGYLMIVGAGTTVYALVRLLIMLLVEAQKTTAMLP